tara:strand:+ start:3483 stop:3881 length:399 start_codon:yes stop_codon:yes gene_type:complete
MTQKQKNYRNAFIFLNSLFFLWGFITVLVDSLIPRMRDLFTLTYFQAGLVQFAFFGAYFVLSILAGFMLSKIEFKKGIVLGLITMIVGGAIIPPMYGYLTDLYGLKWAFSLLIICYLYIYFFGKVQLRKNIV